MRSLQESIVSRKPLRCKGLRRTWESTDLVVRSVFKTVEAFARGLVGSIPTLSRQGAIEARPIRHYASRTTPEGTTRTESPRGGYTWAASSRKVSHEIGVETVGFVFFSLVQNAHVNATRDRKRYTAKRFASNFK